MKRLMAKLLVITTIIALMLGGTGQAQTKRLDFSDYRQKSPEKAAKYSVIGMLIPIVAGIAWWKIDNPKTKTETRYYDGWSYTSTHTEDPDHAIPAILIFSGIFLGPSAGYFYGGCPGRGVKGVLLRVGTGALTAVAASAAASSYESDEALDFSGIAAAATVGAIGSGMILIEAIIDIAKVKGAIEKNNIERTRQAGTNVKLLPRYFADSNAGGLELNITF